MRLKGKKILLGISASIAAYKIPFLVRLLKKEGADVQIVMTPNARDFVTPLTLSTLSERPVLSEPFDQIDGSWNNHVELGQWADLIIFAPLSASTMAKMSSGMSDNLLTTIYLSAKCPVFFAPAMDLDMYAHPSTSRNLETLLKDGNRMIEAQTGELASGLSGKGRMEEPDNILEIIVEHFNRLKSFKGKKVLITSGPTYEMIDPVRFIGNFSSGKMGTAIAIELAERGALVNLISGPTAIDITASNIKSEKVVSADQMFRKVEDYFDKSDLCIFAAAVSDYRPMKTATSKIKKKSDELPLKLVPTTDILKAFGAKKTNQFIMGFALETENELVNAAEKLKNKNCDAIVLNSLRDEKTGFGFDTNKISILGSHHPPLVFDLKSKSLVAKDICNYLEKEFLEL
jgi:phosphopantothenoylcysteine decarboxylase/phosphopantothenate--cysteine ligase